jgi:hypothetical protein
MAVDWKGVNLMATPVREFSYDQQILEHLKFCGLDRENLIDLVGLFVSLKNKYGLLLFAIAAEGSPIPNALTARYVVDSITLGKVTHVVLDTPRFNRLAIIPRGVPKTTQYEMAVTLGG